MNKLCPMPNAITTDKLNIYVISLSSDFERRKRLRERFSRRFFEFEFIEALDLQKRDFCGQQRAPSLLRNSPHPLTLSELGCALSHMRAYEIFLAAGTPRALILEDDVIGCDSDLDIIEKASASLSGDAFVLCGGQQGQRGARHLYGRPTQTNDLYQLPSLMVRFTTRACCYLVTRERAELLLSKQKKGIHRADDWGRLLSDCNHVYFLQALAHPTDLSDSHIEHDRFGAHRNSRWRKLLADGVFFTIKNQFAKLLVRVFAYFNNLQSLSYIAKNSGHQGAKTTQFRGENL